MSRTGKRNSLKKHTFPLCLTFVLVLSTLGIGWGMWSDTLTLGGEVSMGEMKPVVTIDDYYDEDYDGEQVWIWIPFFGRVLIHDWDVEVITVTGSSETGFTVDISDATRRDVFDIEFSIRNDGTVPFHYDFQAGPNHEPRVDVEVDWDSSSPASQILDCGEEAGGIITLNDGTFSGAHDTHDLDFGFVFTQYNIEPQ